MFTSLFFFDGGLVIFGKEKNEVVSRSRLTFVFL